MRMKTFVAVVTGLVVSSLTASAATTFYTNDRAGFEAALGALTVEDFNGLVLPNSDSIVFSGITSEGTPSGESRAQNASGTPVADVFNGRLDTSGFDTGIFETITWSFAGVVGIGFDVISGASQTGVTVSGSGFSFDFADFGGIGSGFFGVIIDTGDPLITSLTFQETILADGESTNEIFQLDNVTFSREFAPPGGEVPEPGTMSLLGAGLIALGFVARRKTAKS